MTAMRFRLPFTAKPVIERTEVRIAIASFLLLFLELLLIRWLAAYVLHLAYFSNLVLLASFFGIGLGFLLADRKPMFRLFPYFLFACAAVVVNRVDISFLSSQALYFQEMSPERLTVPFWIIAPLLFAFVASVFVGPAQLLGSLFRKVPPLTAYAWDVGGSMAGIAAFALCSASGTGPLVWFAVVVTAYLALAGAEAKALAGRHAVAFIALFTVVAALTIGTLWSPYYKIVVRPIGNPEEPTGYTLYANETGHQTLERPEDKEWIYRAPYDFFADPSYENVLIIGAGGGSDVATALAQGAAHVDAVDIDPTIVQLGRSLHPSEPYADPRVRVTVADGRTFLERTTKKYDLIIYALTDSLALASSYSNTRLESYLYTQESFNLAKERLNDGGLVVLYNYYREPWLVAKLAGMLENAFGAEPYVVAPPSAGALAAIMSGPKLADRLLDSPEQAGLVSAPQPATDEWPFVYMKRPAFPDTYAVTVIVIAALAFLAIRSFRPDVLDRKRFPWHFFFLGAGFLLLETKNVINFQLLFGSTWSVNAMVFLAILALVFAAIVATRRGFAPSPRVLYAGLAATLALNLIIPLSTLAPLPTATRYVAAALLTLSPIFFANLVFSRSFKDVRKPDEAFAANLLGAMVGGFAEYGAMLTGYHWIMVVAVAFYGAAWATRPEGQD